MRDLSSYPISFPYGVTTAPYNPSHPHRGDDRAAPLNTPVVVQGVTIGLVGMTGFATGPHCHNQEWQGNKLNVRKPQNAFKGGTVSEVDPIGNTGDGSLGKYVTVRNDDGWNTSYCHLNVVKVKVGDKLQGGQNMPTNQQIDEWISIQHFIAFGVPANEAVFNDWRSVLKNNFVEGSISILKGIDGNPGALKNKAPAGFKPVGELYIKE